MKSCSCAFFVRPPAADVGNPRIRTLPLAGETLRGPRQARVAFASSRSGRLAPHDFGETRPCSFALAMAHGAQDPAPARQPALHECSGPVEACRDSPIAQGPCAATFVPSGMERYFGRPDSARHLRPGTKDTTHRKTNEARPSSVDGAKSASTKRSSDVGETSCPNSERLELKGSIASGGPNGRGRSCRSRSGFSDLIALATHGGRISLVRRYSASSGSSTTAGPPAILLNKFWRSRSIAARTSATVVTLPALSRCADHADRTAMAEPVAASGAREHRHAGLSVVSDAPGACGSAEPVEVRACVDRSSGPLLPWAGRRVRCASALARRRS